MNYTNEELIMAALAHLLDVAVPRSPGQKEKIDAIIEEMRQRVARKALW